MTVSSLPFGTIENDFLRVDYLTTTGPRIIGLYAKGVEGNFLAETPDVHWPTPYGEYYLRGGHRLWIAPEDPFFIRPEGNVTVIIENGKVALRSDVDSSGLEKEISFHLDENCVSLTHRVMWHGKESIELAPWSITQLHLGGVAVLPQSNSDGLLPDRNLVFWPYSQVNDERLELHDDVIMIHGRASEQALKVGQYNSRGWVAYLFGAASFIKHFAVHPIQSYPDMGCNVEVYVRDVCAELEVLGPLIRLKPKDSLTLEETWEIRAGEYPITLEQARMINKQLSMK